MSLKDSLEKNLVWFGLSMIALGAGGSWAVAEALRVSPKVEKIADLEKRVVDLTQVAKDQNAAVEPYQRELVKMLANNKQLELQLRNSEGSLEQGKSALESWRIENNELQANIRLYAANCSLIGQVKGIEQKKETVERDLYYNANNSASGSQQRAEDWRRMVGEYQARLLQLQSKLSCQPGG